MADNCKATLEAMTEEEKVKLVVGMSPCKSRNIEEKNIRSMVMSDGATGVNGSQVILDYMADKVAKGEADTSLMQKGWQALQELMVLSPDELCAKDDLKDFEKEFVAYLKERRNKCGEMITFPSGINIGACFHEERAYEIGRAVGLEDRASHVDMCLGPNVDIIRDPLGGRNYEMYGEDPVLVGRTSAAFVKGLQSVGVAACVKHFIANNQETNRQTKDTHVSERTLRELYAKGFEYAVKQGDAKSVMSAYNAVNGVFSSYNKWLLTDLLKKEWGFEGVVASDWGAVTTDYDKSVNAGMDLILHGSIHPDLGNLPEKIHEKEVPPERLDDAVTRILNLEKWLEENQTPVEYNQMELLRQNYELLVDGTVLLKNSGVLPLAGTEKVWFDGKQAESLIECGSGSTYIMSSLHTNVKEECEKNGINVADNQRMADTLIFVAGADGGENTDRKGMTLDEEDEMRIAKVLKEAKADGKKTVVVLNIAGPVEMGNWIDSADAILVIFIPGCMGGKATADILMGKAVPAGKLPITFPLKLTDAPTAPYTTGELRDVYYSEGVFVGYRWYDAKQLAVAYPFGYGLSYTSIETIRCDIPENWDIDKEEEIRVLATVKNTGDIRGSEVIQVYMGECKNRLPRPEKELKGYQKVYLNPGEQKTVEVTIPKDTLRMYDPEKGDVIPVGQYTVQVGFDSQNFFEEKKIEVTGKNPYSLDENSTVGEILGCEATKKVVETFLPGFFEKLGDNIKFVKDEPIKQFLSKALIGAIPDANKLNGILNIIFENFKH